MSTTSLPAGEGVVAGFVYIASFVEFLAFTGLWLRWQENYPLPYVSPNAPIPRRSCLWNQVTAAIKFKWHALQAKTGERDTGILGLASIEPPEQHLVFPSIPDAHWNPAGLSITRTSRTQEGNSRRYDQLMMRDGCPGRGL